MGGTLTAGAAMVRVLESWGVRHVYGLPGGSINSTMAALYASRGTVRYIQVRHEETGALAASAEAKLSGNVGVCFGSAGPGATHLFNGLYDAQMDHAPVLALVGQVASGAMNYDSFQELNENPMFADVSVYNRTVMTPESLPHVVDEAIRRALAEQGVAVVTIPVDYPLALIPDASVSTAGARRQGVPLPDPADIAAAVPLLAKADRPVLYAGQGARGAGEELLAVSDHFSMPIVLSVPAKGIIPDAAPNLMGSAGRLSTKPANEALAAADLILFVGSDFPFAAAFFPPEAAFIQVDVDPAKLGRRHRVDTAILGDAKAALAGLRAAAPRREDSGFLRAARQNRRNWNAWLQGFENSADAPLRAEPVFREIRRIAAPDAVFVADVGNCTIDAVRLLDMNGSGQQFTTSGWFATMGYGVPAGIAAQLCWPKRQVVTLSGDGGFAMVMQDILTQVKYKLPIINVVFSNGSLGFIEAEQEDTRQERYGVLLQRADFAMAARAMGALGISVSRPEELAPAFDAAAQAAGPVVIDVALANLRPFPAEAMVLDKEKYGADAVRTFTERYAVSNMPLLRELLEHSESRARS